MAKTADELKADLMKAKLRGLQPKGTGTPDMFFEGVGRFGRGVNRALLRSIGIVPEEQAGPLSVPLPGKLFDTPFTRPAGGVLGRAGEEVGANLPFMGGFQAAAPVIKRLAQEGTNVVQRALGRLASGAASTPGRAVTGETMATIGSGTGAGIAQEAAPGSQAAEIAGQLAGGLAPSAFMLAPSRAAAKAGVVVGRRALETSLGGVEPETILQAQRLLEKAPVVGGPLSRLVGTAAEKGRTVAQEGAGSSVARRINKAIGPEERAALVRAQELEAKIPGLNVPLSAATKQPDLLATHMGLQRYMDQGELSALRGIERGNARAVQQYAFQNTPKSDLTPQYVIDTMSGKIQGLKEAHLKATAEVTGQKQAIAAELPSVNRAEAGDAIRTSQLARYKSESSRLRYLRRSLQLEGVDITGQFNQWRDTTLATLDAEDIGLARNTPGLKRVIDDLGRPSMTSAMTGKDDVRVVNLEQLEKLDQELFDLWRTYKSGANPDFSRARVVSQIRKSLSGEGGFIDQLDSELGENYRYFKSMWRRDIIEPFRNSTAFKATAENARGFYRSHDEEVATMYFRPGRRDAISAAAAFNKVFRNDPKAIKTLEDVAIDDLRATAVVDGIIDEAKLTQWRSKYADALGQYPNISKKVGDISTAVTEMARRQAELDTRWQQIADDKLTAIVAKVNKADLLPEEGVAKIVRDPKLMAQAWTQLDDDGKAALSRHVWDGVINENGQVINQFIETHMPTLKMLFGDKGLDNLKVIAEAKDLIGSVPQAPGRSFDPNPLVDMERQMGMSFPMIASRGRELYTGRTQGAYVVADLLSRFVRGHAAIDMERAWKAAMFDKQFADDLIWVSRTGAFKTPRAKRLMTRFLLLGQGGEEQQEPRQESPLQPAPQNRAIPQAVPGYNNVPP